MRPSRRPSQNSSRPCGQGGTTRQAKPTRSHCALRWEGRLLTRTFALLALLALLVVLALPSFSLVALAAPLGGASEQHLAARQSVPPTTSSGQVTIVVLDSSGSMGNSGGSGNDPNGLRCSAANAYIALSGPNQFIGAIGLVDTTGSGQAQIWAEPSEMATIQARTQLVDTIQSKSDNCHANGDTPTYDALAKAYAMLASATTGGRSGSVILLTDGVPEPNQQQQVNNIISQLVPKFAHAGWPINTIALGNDPATGPFLRNLSSGTNGSYYDDINPATGQPDPLEIAPVFLDLFAALTGRTPKPLVAQQALSGGTTSRNFSVASLVQHLDVVVIKQDPSATVTLTSPEGIQFSQSTSSVLVATDPHFAIFSIDGPTPGNWIANISGGSGDFSVYGLVTTNLRIALTQPSGTQLAFPIDQPLTVSARLTSGNVDVNGDYTVTGKLTAGSQVIQQVILTHQTGSAVYSGAITLPTHQPSGTYDLTLYVTQGSADVLTSSTPRAINFEIFPTPYLLSGARAQVTHVATNAIAFDPILRRIYSLPVISWFSGAPLENLPAVPSAQVDGVVTLHNTIYQNASVAGSVTTGGHASGSVGVADTTPGHFQVTFPVAQNGQYTLTLNTTGTYQDSHGAFGTQQRLVTLTVVPATSAQEARAWAVTLIYLVIAIFLSPLVYRWFLASRKGAWVLHGRTRAQSESGAFNRLLGRRNYLRRWFRPNTVSSEELWGYPGLLFIWRRLGSDEIAPVGRGSADWTPSRRDTIAGKLNYRVDGNTSIAIEISDGERKTAGFQQFEASASSARRQGFSGTGASSFGASRSASRDGTGGRGGFGSGRGASRTDTRGQAQARPASRTPTPTATARGGKTSTSLTSRSSGGFGRPH